MEIYMQMTCTDGVTRSIHLSEISSLQQHPDGAVLTTASGLNFIVPQTPDQVRAFLKSENINYRRIFLV